MGGGGEGLGLLLRVVEKWFVCPLSCRKILHMYTTRIMFVSMLLELYCPLFREAQKLVFYVFVWKFFEMLDVESEMSYPKWAYGKCKLCIDRTQASVHNIIGIIGGQ